MRLALRRRLVDHVAAMQHALVLPKLNRTSRQLRLSP